ncbi:MAG TPA: hypothetical protein VF126_02795 [Acidobacteriaceae bacterium]
MSLKHSLRAWLMAGVFLAAGPAGVSAQGNTAPFDLNGPRIDMRVTRGGKTLPIAEVPNLQPGDKVWVHPDLPASQSAHYLLVVAFLRGATNPPPENWFLKEETWQKKAATEGIHFTVPADAQQTLLFLAPETGGDYKTLRNAVRGRPGSFVRASQDLNQASLDRSRVQTYLSSVRDVSETDPKSLEATSKLLARSLSLKVKQDCFELPQSEQEQCLTQNSDALVMNDGHESMVSSLTSGPGTDLAQQLSYSPTAGAGYYSAYVGAVIDVAKLLESLHTAEYQYIPALTFPKGDALDLKLNNPPSFHNPKSVIVVALPAVETPQLPPLHAIDSKQVACLQGPSVVLPVEGAPLVYSTSLAHSLALHVEGKSGRSIDLPVRAIGAKGGLVVDASAVPEAKLDPHVVGKIVGMWGFDRLDGPSFNLNVPHPTTWRLDKADANSLVVGRDDEVRLHGNGAACVAEIQLRDSTEKETKAEFKVVKPDELEVKVPMTDAATGAAGLLVRQRGLESPDQVAIQAYAQAGHLDALHFHAGDSTASLVGTRLDEVASVDLKDVRFLPGDLSHSGEKDTLMLKAADPKAAAALPVNLHVTAHVLLKDGRSLQMENTVSGHRPQVMLTGKSVALSPEINNLVHLVDPNELPAGGNITFVLKTVALPGFSRSDKVEVASDDQTLHTTLGVSDGSLVLQDSSTLMGSFDPMKSFGPSAFGKLQVRAIDASGAPGDWIPLGTLVRVPLVASVKCGRATKAAAAAAATAATQAEAAGDTPDATAGSGPPPAVNDTTTPAANDPNAQCTLNGTSLFLIDSIASDPQFTHSISVPDGYTNPTLAVPKPASGELYLHLRDDPAVANTIAVPPNSATLSKNAGAGVTAAAAHPHADTGDR